VQPDPEKVYSLEAVCALFHLADRSAYYRLVREGKFPRPRKIAGKWGYTRSEIDAYLLLAGRWEPGPFEAEPPKRDADDEA
jgi:predicted DNA-binding transcriptional regulator AlpA